MPFVSGTSTKMKTNVTAEKILKRKKQPYNFRWKTRESKNLSSRKQIANKADKDSDIAMLEISLRKISDLTITVQGPIPEL